VFGTDSLKDDASKLTRIYLKVKGGTLSNEEYRHTSISCQLFDITTIDFFTKIEGNKRLSVTALLCSGLSRLYSKLAGFPVSTYDITQVFGRLMCIDEVDWVIGDISDLKLSISNYHVVNSSRISIYIQEELWGIIYKISIDFGITFSHLVLYLLRSGICGYNEFIERFSSKSEEVSYEYLKYAEKYEKLLISILEIRYSDMFKRVKYLYDTYDSILEKEHKNLKEEMKRIIDIYESSAKG